MSNISFKPVITQKEIESGKKFNVKFRIVANRNSRYITTNIVAYPDQFNKKFQIRDLALSGQINELHRKMDSAAMRIPMRDIPNLTINEIIDRVKDIIDNDNKKEEGFSLDFPSYGAKIANEKPKYSKVNYMCAIHALQDYVGINEFDISKISSSFMHNFENWLRAKHGQNARAVSLYTAAVAYIHKRAREEFNNYETDEINIRNPFAHYTCPKQKPSKHRSVEIDIIQKIIDERKNVTGREKTGIDIFLISFSLMGMNSPDIYSCRPARSGVIIYERTKTRDRRADDAEMHVRLESIAKDVYGPYLEKKGDHAFLFHTTYSDYKNMARAANLGLASFCERIGIPKVTIYTARHAWATIARKAGVEKATINDCLCHVDPGMRTTDIYVEKDWSIMWAANRKVLSLFKWD